MGLFGRSKGKPKKVSEHDVVGDEEVLGVLQRALDQKVLISVETGGQGLPERARIVGFEQERTPQVILRFYTPQGLSRGDTLDASFESSDWRWVFSTTVEELLEDEGYRCRLPDILSDNERRATMRARLRRTETVQVAAVSGLFAGTAATGVLTEISSKGFCFRPTKVMDVASKGTMPLTSVPFGVGKQFVVIRMKVPGAYREAEFSATVSRSWGAPPVLYVAFDFDKIKDDDLDAVKRMVDARVSRRAVMAPAFPDEAGGLAAEGVEIGAKAEAKAEPKPEAMPQAKSEPAPEANREESPLKAAARPAVVVEEKAAAPASSPVVPARKEGRIEPLVEAAAPEPGDEVDSIEVEAIDVGAAPDLVRVAPIEAFRRGAPAVSAPQIVMDRSSGVLIVGDTSISRSQIRTMINHAGYGEIYEADGGQRAMEMLAESPCALVLLSMNLPDMLPLKFVMMMRESEPLQAVPIIAVARTLSHGEIVGLKGIGVNDILIRPIDPVVLTAKMAKYIPASFAQGRGVGSSVDGE